MEDKRHLVMSYREI